MSQYEKGTFADYLTVVSKEDVDIQRHYQVGWLAEGLGSCRRRRADGSPIFFLSFTIADSAHVSTLAFSVTC